MIRLTMPASEVDESHPARPEQHPAPSPHTSDHLANERTFLAWIRTSISMIGLGLLFFLVAAIFMIPAVNTPSAPVFWWGLKLFLVMYIFIWMRGTFPRYRYDQLMNIGWKIMIPVALGAIFVNAIVGILRG